MNGEPLLMVRDLVVEHGDFTLHVPSWDVRPGTVVGVVGPNGAGKTTLLNELAGLGGMHGVRRRGRVEVLGVSPWEDAAFVRSHLGFMNDDMALWSLRIRKLLRLVSGYYPSWDAALVERLLERFELDLEKKTTELSKGQGTRLRLVLAMAFRPRVLVLDEPGSGLDLSGRRSLLREVLEVVADEGRAVIISSHQLEDLERMVDHVLAISRGEVVADGTIEALVGEDRTLEEAMIGWGAV